MIFSFEGLMGEGKTMDAVALVYTDAMQRKVKVIANIHLLPPFGTEIPFEYVDTKQFVEYMQDTDNNEMNDCDVLFDETYQLMEARRSGSKVVLLFSYYMLQTRKRRADLFCCFHNIKAVDGRLRLQIDWRGTCHMRLEEPCSLCGGRGEINVDEKKYNEGNFAIYKQNGLSVPVMVGGKETYHGKTSYKLKSLLDLDGEAMQILGQGKKPFIVDESQVLFNPNNGNGHTQLATSVEWDRCFDFVRKEKQNAETILCERCLGYKKTGFSTIRFRDMKTGNPPKSLRVFGPAVWSLYDTEERIPLTKQQLRVKPEDL